ncbi:MAG: ABC transporter ATP-binding protein, partial [Anaerolineae bacterium]|nr:ABC transporter ATP-binding protein [Anaerolineae bacterium]
YLPESVPLYTDMTVFDYLKFMADLNKVENAEDKVDEILEVVRLGDRAVSYIEKLSKGMRQRVGLAQALLHEPEVLILDEPTIGLDPGQIRGVRELIQDIGKKRTILLSTHILVEAQEICDRVLIMNNGKIVAEDTPENLEATLSGGSQIKLRVGGEAEKILSKLEKIKGVSNVKQSGEGAFELTTSADVDARPEIARAVVKANLDLLELRQVSMSLEDIFLEVTKNDGSSNDGGEE